MPTHLPTRAGMEPSQRGLLLDQAPANRDNQVAFERLGLHKSLRREEE